MRRERENRLFGKPASVACLEDPLVKFTIVLNPEELKNDINDSTSESVEVKLVQFAKSEYAKQLAQSNDCDTFIQYCLDNIYHVSIADILKKNTKIIDGSWKVESDYLIYMAVALAAGLVVAAEVGAIAVAIVVGDPGGGEGPGPADISSAAVICGGKEFGENVVNRYCAMLQMEAEKRWAKNV